MMPLSFTAHQILNAIRHSQPEFLYKSGEFSRLKFLVALDGSTVEVTVDTLEKEGIEFLYIRVPVSHGTELQFTLSGLLSQAGNAARGTIYRFHEGLPLIWMPKPPLARRRDRFNRILQEVKCEIRGNGDTWHIRVPADLYNSRLSDPGGAEDSVDMVWVAFSKNQDKYVSELATTTPWEEKRYTVLGSGGYIQCLSDFFDYLIGGYIYRLSPAPKGRTTAGDEAYSVFLIAETLARQTEKGIYRSLQNEIAYGLLSSLDSQGRWRHGSWSDDMETHTRFQADGINLLLHYYRLTGQPQFLDGASQAAQFLISIAEEVRGGGLWFRHDTLDMSTAEFWLKRPWRRTVFRLPREMFTLNTHIHMLQVLYEIRKELNSEATFSEAIGQGWIALRDILEAGPAEWLYGWLSRLLDNRLAFPQGKQTGLSRFLARGSRFSVGRAMAYIKWLFPRLVMPNGFIDASLNTQRGLAYGYHFINLWDLVRLYRYSPEPWLRSLIDRSVHFSCQSHMMEYAFNTKLDNIELVAEAFQVYTATTPSFNRSRFADILQRLKEMGGGVTPGLLGFDMRVVPLELQTPPIKVSDRDVDLVNISHNPGSAEFMVVNATIGQKPITCEIPASNSASEIDKDSFTLTTSKGAIARLAAPHFTLQPYDYGIIKFQYK